MDMSYTEILQLGFRFDVPFDKTWTCLHTGSQPCGKCEPCKARVKAFIEAGVIDPLFTPVPV